MTSTRFAILGSAHLDILSRIRDHAETLDRPGDLFIGYGGTGFNMAINLAALGHPVVFGTALADTGISRTIIQTMQQAGVRVCTEFRAGLPEAGFSAHVDPQGEMVSAITSTPVEQVCFDEGWVDALIQNADAVILECNLQVETLIQAARIANHQGKQVWLAGVSEAKALKVLDLGKAGLLIDGLFLNDRELAYVLTAARLSPLDLAARLGGFIIETRGAQGVSVWGSEQPVPVASSTEGDYPRNHHRRKEVRHWLGAGDHLMALTLHRHCDLIESLPMSAIAASAVVTAHHAQRNCNLGPVNPLEDRLRHLSNVALRDPLTGLVNRRGLEDALAQLNGDAAMALLMIDIDHFKRVNDEWGHDIGDKVLAGVGEVISGLLRDADCACRWGGEEMIVILPRATEEEGMAVAERIRVAIGGRTFPCGRVACSIGVAAGLLGDLDGLRGEADRALYHGKQTGRNKVVLASQIPIQIPLNLDERMTA